MPEINDKEVLDIMVDGGRKLCEYARTQWMSGKYGCEIGSKMFNENYQRWLQIEQRISELRHRIIDAFKSGSL